jgi:hypothetical protein
MASKNLTPAQLKEVLGLLKQIKKGYESLDQTLPDPFANVNAGNIEKVVKDLGGAPAVLKKWTIELDKVEDQLDTVGKNAKGLFSTFTNILSEVKNNNEQLNVGKKSIATFQSIAEKLKNDQQGITELGYKDLQNLKAKGDKAKDNLASSVKELENQLQGNKLSKEQIKAAETLIAENKKEATAIEDVLNLTEKRLESEKKIQKTLGVTGGLFKGISSVLSKIGVDSQDIADMNSNMREAAESGDKFAAFGAGVKGAFKGIGNSLKDPLIQLGLINNLFKMVLKYAYEFDDAVNSIQKTLAINANQALNLANNFKDVSNNLKDGYINYLDLINANNELNNAMGTSVQLSSKQLKDSIDLKDKLGLEVDERESILGLSIRTGKTQEQIFDSISAQGKGILNNRKVLAEVLKTSGQLRILYKDNPDLLSKAVIQAQRLGMTLEQTKNISRGLLNFEESISSELEAELLTGQDLNLERARALALTGDTAGAAAELMKNLGPNGLQRFQKMNVIQQESYAKALGMSVDELSDSLIKQKQLNHLNVADQQKLREKVQELRNAGKEEEAIALEKAARESKSLRDAEKSAKLSELNRKQSEITARNMENLKREFTSLLQGPVLSIMKFANQIMSNPVLKSLAAGVGVLAGIAGTIALGKTIIGTIGSVFGKGNKDKPTGSEKEPFWVKMKGFMGMMGGKDGGGDEGGSKGEDLIDELLGGDEGKKGGKAGFLKQAKTLFKNPKVLGRALKMKGGGSILKGLLKGGGKSLLKGAGGLGAIAGGFALDYAEEQQLAKSQQLKEQAQAAKTVKEKEELLKRAQKTKRVGQAAGVGSAALTGAGIGATIGSVIPGLGTVVGGGIGAGVGALGALLSNYFDDSEEAQDFILRPGQKPLKFRKDDIVMGGTKLESGRTSSTNNDALLKEFQEMKQILTAILNKEGTITLNGTKMGTAMAVGSYKVQ